MNIKKLLLGALSLVLVAAIAVGGTLAYFTDRDSQANVFTVGNVSIDLNEDFDQGATLIPGVNIEKKPTVTNTGKNDAWVWLTFSIPSALDNFVQGTEQGSNENVIHWNPKGATTEGYVTAERVDAAIAADFFKGFDTANLTADSINTNKMHWNVFNSLGEGKNVYTENICGVNYNTYVLLYNKALEPGETTLPNIEKVFLDARVDIDPNGDWYFVDGGNTKKLSWNSNTNGNPVIYVGAYGIQAEGFADVKAAYAAYQTQWGTNGKSGSGVSTKAPVMEGNTLELTSDYVLVDEPLFSNHAATEDYTINGNGAVVEGIASSVDAFTWEGGTIPAMSPIFSSEDGSKVTVNDLTFTGTMSAVMLGHYVDSNSNWYNTEFNNVDIINAEVVSFSAGISPAACVYGTAVLNNCNIYGTTLSELDTDPMWPVYDMAVVNYSNTTINKSKVGSIFVWNQAKLTIADGTEVDSIIIRGNMNTTKYGVTIEAGATVGSIDLSNITNKAKINFTIADGATVGKIVANGVEYASITEWQNA